MKKIVLLLIVSVSMALACIPPIKPLPPIGCQYSDAVLIRVDNYTCYWQYQGC